MSNGLTVPDYDKCSHIKSRVVSTFGVWCAVKTTSIKPDQLLSFDISYSCDGVRRTVKSYPAYHIFDIIKQQAKLELVKYSKTINGFVMNTGQLQYFL